MFKRNLEPTQICNLCGSSKIEHNKEVDGENIQLCQECYSNLVECEDCGELTNKATYIDESDKKVCKECILNYEQCVSCGEYGEELIYVGSVDMYYCECCVEDIK